MADNLTTAQRSYCMSRVRSYGNKSTEVVVARLLREHGIKGWRRHLPIPGKPDFAFPKCKLAIFVDGCFWHGHTCRNLTPTTNAAMWRRKIACNRRRRTEVKRALRQRHWRTLSVWECQLRKSPEKTAALIARSITRTHQERDHAGQRVQ